MLHTIKKKATRNSEPMKNNFNLFKKKDEKKNWKSRDLQFSLKNNSVTSEDFFMIFFSKCAHQQALTNVEKRVSKFPVVSEVFKKNFIFTTF